MRISTSVAQLQPGLYILRHPGQGMPPLSVTTTPNSHGVGEVLSAKKSSGTTLRDTSDCIVMRVSDGPVEILIAAFSSDSAFSAAPSIRIDSIALGMPSKDAPKRPAPVADSPRPKGIVVSDKGLSVIGHIERVGEVVANEGQLVGDPSTNHRLEGFQIVWPDKPQGVELVYGVSVEGSGALPPVLTGSFSGTRGEGRRVTEVTFGLTGPQAAKYEFTGAAYFSGGFQVPIVAGVPLSGPSGFEHLTGLALAVVPAKSAVKRNVWDESPKTKVFKSESAVPATKTAVKAVVKASSIKKTGATAQKKRKA